MRGIVTTLAFALALASRACAIVTSDEAGSHVVVPGQPAFGVNLDGVVLIGTRLPNVNTITRLLPKCTAALISDRHLLCAGHCFDENYDGVVDEKYTAITHTAAFELVDGVAMVNIDPTMIQFPENWPQERADIAVVTLTDIAPAAAPRYSLFAGVNELGRTAVMAGYGITGHGATGSVVGSVRPRAKRAGLNRIEAIRVEVPGVEYLMVDFDSGQPADNTLSLIGVESDLGFGADEVLSAPGDSGGPMFVGQAIAGIIAVGFNPSEVDPHDRNWGEQTLATRVSNFRDFIQMATGGTAVFVPEPANVAVVIAAVMSVWMQRCRKQPQSKRRTTEHTKAVEFWPLHQS
jgi:hypothetical protein